jgi:hypothetical protein
LRQEALEPLMLAVDAKNTVVNKHSLEEVEENDEEEFMDALSNQSWANQESECEQSATKHRLALVRHGFFGHSFSQSSRCFSEDNTRQQRLAP